VRQQRRRPQPDPGDQRSQAERPGHAGREAGARRLAGDGTEPSRQGGQQRPALERGPGRLTQRPEVVEQERPGEAEAVGLVEGCERGVRLPPELRQRDRERGQLRWQGDSAP
jgi:hypothetical protein